MDAGEGTASGFLMISDVAGPDQQLKQKRLAQSYSVGPGNWRAIVEVELAWELIWTPGH
jgi:hypothetical protein